MPWYLTAILLIVVARPAVVAAAPTIASVDKSLPGEVQVSLAADGRATLRVTLPETAASAGGAVSLGEFRNTTGRAVDVFFVPAATKARTLTLPKGTLEHFVAVEASPLGRGETARGELVLASPPGTVALRKTLALTRPGKRLWQGVDDEQNVREILAGTDGRAVLQFDPRPLPAGHAGDVTVRLSDFFDKSGGESVKVRLVDALADGGLRVAPATGWPLEVRLDASAVRAGKAYHGALEVRAAGRSCIRRASS